MINSINLNLPTDNKNYCTVDRTKLKNILDLKEAALPDIKENLKNSKSEKDVVENLYILNELIDCGVKGTENLYPELSQFNNTKSANIQTFLAGIYRKTLIPDAFGPLVNMLIKNSITDAFNDINGIKTTKHFDANEEIGGAIINYLA